MYGVDEDLFVGVPTEISANGVRPIKVEISDKEKSCHKYQTIL
nr:hypothetical protein [Francisella philomiragia]